MKVYLFYSGYSGVPQVAAPNPNLVDLQKASGIRWRWERHQEGFLRQGRTGKNVKGDLVFPFGVWVYTLGQEEVGVLRPEARESKAQRSIVPKGITGEFNATTEELNYVTSLRWMALGRPMLCPGGSLSVYSVVRATIRVLALLIAIVSAWLCSLFIDQNQGTRLAPNLQGGLRMTPDPSPCKAWN